jgi:hypothetical protein
MENKIDYNIPVARRVRVPPSGPGQTPTRIWIAWEIQMFLHASIVKI